MKSEGHDEPDGLREKIGQRIEQLRGEIAGKVDEVKGLSRFLSDEMNPEDQALDDAVADVDSAEILRDVTELREARRALAKLDAGSYGFCARCEQAIPADRLLAQPLAAHCIECQTRIEAGETA